MQSSEKQASTSKQAAHKISQYEKCDCLYLLKSHAFCIGSLMKNTVIGKVGWRDTYFRVRFALLFRQSNKNKNNNNTKNNNNNNQNDKATTATKTTNNKDLSTALGM
ncbi:unnamed protein product [Polarella glacialis]|uniref:Uncharacterized protein n=1 Tax=Polarella glacialis TaxID=89957 RepID=A0A813F1X2_POLGL|nr:unnamed protein product [Polarella glacialis]